MEHYAEFVPCNYDRRATVDTGKAMGYKFSTLQAYFRAESRRRGWAAEDQARAPAFTKSTKVRFHQITMVAKLAPTLRQNGISFRAFLVEWNSGGEMKVVAHDCDNGHPGENVRAPTCTEISHIYLTSQFRNAADRPIFAMLMVSPAATPIRAIIERYGRAGTDPNRQVGFPEPGRVQILPAAVMDRLIPQNEEQEEEEE